MLTTVNKIKLLREAGSVERCHLVPHQGSYSVAAHTYGVLCLILTVWPDASPQLLRAALVHDVPERWVGDIPSQVKDTLGGALDEMESKVLRAVGFDELLSDDDRMRLAYADQIELFLWCKDETRKGNDQVYEMMRSIRLGWEGNLDFPEELKKLVTDLEHDAWNRLPEDWENVR